jgi:nucleoid-associated protein YgaU
MTRENKLALVVGFGLILFVGILISDHFSVVRNQKEAANLSTQLRDPLLATNVQSMHEPALIELQPLKETKPEPSTAIDPGMSASTDPGSADLAADTHTASLLPPPVETPRNSTDNAFPNTIAMGPTPRNPQGAIPEGFEPVPDSKSAATANFKFHDVQSGDSLFSICKQHYGNANMVDALAKFNKIDDPSSLRTGRRLLIPTPQEMGFSAPPSTVVASNTSGQGLGTIKSDRVTPTGRDASSASNASSAGNTPSGLKIVQSRPVTVSPPAGNTSPLVQLKMVATPPTPKDAAPRVTYTVKQGETLRMIALKVMGSKNKWNKLYDMNRDVIDDPDNLKVGTQLRIS